jgi:signal transduction histidine kinase
MAMVREVSRRLRENDEMTIEDLRLKAGELAYAYQRLAQEEFARREFLSSIAHELRTPLTAASGFLEMARKKMLEGDALDMAIETVSRNVQQMQPLLISTSFSSERFSDTFWLTSAASMLISLMSLTMTATRRPLRLLRI